MSYHMQLVLKKSLLILVKGSLHLMSFVAKTYENNPKVDTHKFHTIQNNYTTPCQTSNEGIKNQ